MSVALALVVMSVIYPASAGEKRLQERRSGDAVLAVIDTGINPYHVTFRDSSARAKTHPSKYIDGYPKDAEALKLSFDQPNYWSAVKRDCERVWSKIETGKLYWIPGTKIVGAISFAPQTAIDCNAAEPTAVGRILDSDGHGTMTASRAASNEYGACTGCSVVTVQFSASGFNAQDGLDSIAWAAEQSKWIDAQSNSWGPLFPVWDPSGAGQLIGASSQFVRKVEEVSSKHAAFWASGNGALFRYGVLGHPTFLAPHMTPSAIMVGGHDSGHVTPWSGFPPHVVSDACASWAAEARHLERSSDSLGSGTSAATPFVAGGAGQILIEARRILGDGGTGVSGKLVAKGPKGLVPDGPLADGKFTLEEWKRLLFVTATPRPEAQHEDGPPCGVIEGAVVYTAPPVKWSDLPPDYPEYLNIGYGAVDDPAVDLALSVLRGRELAPDRSETDGFFDTEGSARALLYENAWSKP